MWAFIWSSLLVYLSYLVCEIYIDFLDKLSLWNIGFYTGLGVLLICDRAKNKLNELDEVEGKEKQG